MATAMNGKDVIVYIEDKPVCAQKSVELDRSAAAISISSKLEADGWQRNLQGMKSWKIKCNGVFVVNSDAFVALENAFNEGTSVRIKLIDNGLNYEGNAIITSFPLNVDYEDTITYRLQLLGDGPLESK